MPANQNPDKNRLKKKEKDKEQKKRKYWNQKEKDRKKVPKTLVIEFSVKLLRKYDYTQVTYYSYNKKDYYIGNCLEPKN